MTYSIDEKYIQVEAQYIKSYIANAYDVLLFLNMLDKKVMLNFLFLVSGSPGKPLVEQWSVICLNVRPHFQPRISLKPS